MILLTGASGFVGRAILEAAHKAGIEIRPVYRSIDAPGGGGSALVIPNLEDLVDWSKALNGIDVVIHSAARTQLNINRKNNQIEKFRSVNTSAALNLARQAAAAGVRRFIFISSVKVNGEVTVLGRPFCAEDEPHPEDAYGISKAEAETGLMLLAKKTGMEICIIRPPLVYGRGVKGNFAALIKLVCYSFPLPLAQVIDNRRSMVSLDNLVDLVLTCIHHPKAANQIFLVSDDEDLSTAELIMKISKILGREPCLIWAPNWLILLMASLLGKRNFYQRLICSLQVDVSKTRLLLGWKPQVSVDEGLRRTLEIR